MSQKIYYRDLFEGGPVRTTAGPVSQQCSIGLSNAALLADTNLDQCLSMLAGPQLGLCYVKHMQRITLLFDTPCCY